MVFHSKLNYKPLLVLVSVQDHEKTKTSVCTFLSVLVHFSVIFPNLEEKVVSLIIFSHPDSICFY